MMVALGNFLFHYRNMLFPLLYLGLFLPSPKVFENDRTAALIGLCICLAGQGIRVATIGLQYIIRGGSKRRIYAKDLVTTGIFSHCRNPLYIGNILVLLGLGFFANSVVFLLGFMPLFMFFYQAIVRSEENFLLGKFGDEFREYTSSVNRWLPKLSGLGETFKSMSFRWRRVILKEYNATFVWMTGALAVFMKNLYFGNERAEFYGMLPSALILLVGLIVLYSIARYLKKTKKLRDI